jgi:hypothetical protein
MTSPERWEIHQLIASGVVKSSDFPDLDYKPPPTVDGEPELEEDIDIEVRQEEPPFLVGQTKQSLELSPIRVIKAPDGSLNRTATSGTALAKERAELRKQQAEGSLRRPPVEETTLTSQLGRMLPRQAQTSRDSPVRLERPTSRPTSLMALGSGILSNQKVSHLERGPI